MIEGTSIYLASKLKKMNPEQTPSVNVMRYSIKLILLNFVILPILLISTGILFGDLKQVVLCATGFVVLRFFSGGYHINNAWGCALVSIASFHTLVLMSFLIGSYGTIEYILGTVALILVGIYAPSNIEKQTNFKKENYKWLKIISLALILINFLYIDSLLLASAFFFQGLTLIRERR